MIRGYLNKRGQFYGSLAAMPANERDQATPLVARAHLSRVVEAAGAVVAQFDAAEAVRGERVADWFANPFNRSQTLVNAIGVDVVKLRELSAALKDIA